MKPFTESDRYEITGLTPESVVIDIGGFEGNWSRQIVEKYRCRAHIFEPITEFASRIKDALAKHPQADRFTVHVMGVGATSRKERMGVKGDSSGIVADGPTVEVPIIGVADMMNNSAIADSTIGCMKLNCEGSEYTILEAMLDEGLMCRVKTLHVQFHNVIPRAPERMAYIKNMMNMTHRLIWDAEWCWTGWEAK